MVAVPIVIAKVRIARAVEESSFEVDTSVAPEEHTEAAEATHSRLVATEASDIAKGPSFGAGVDIDTEKRLSCQHLRDCLWWCSSHRFSFEGEVAEHTL